MRLTPSISAIVPVYRSQDTLPELVRRLSAVLSAAAHEYEIILVNDGSPDRSDAVISELMRETPSLRAFELMRNYGQHNALLCGIRAARHDIVVTIDDDLQNPPEEILKLLARVNEGYDVVYGTPRAMRHGLWRNAASRITKLALQSTMGAETASKVSACNCSTSLTIRRANSIATSTPRFKRSGGLSTQAALLTSACRTAAQALRRAPSSMACAPMSSRSRCHTTLTRSPRAD